MIFGWLWSYMHEEVVPSTASYRSLFSSLIQERSLRYFQCPFWKACQPKAYRLIIKSVSFICEVYYINGNIHYILSVYVCCKSICRLRTKERKFLALTFLLIILEFCKGAIVYWAFNLWGICYMGLCKYVY